MTCPHCNDTGVIETGNNDLPCSCPAGDRAIFNSAWVEGGPVTGAVVKRHFLNSSPEPILRTVHRRTFLKSVSAAAMAGAVVPTVLGETTERGYDSATISIRLVEEAPGITALMLLEHGDADYAIIEAYYWTTIEVGGKPVKVMLHEDATSPLVKSMAYAVDIRVPLADIVFLRVRELKLLGQNEFGNRP